MNTKTRYTLAPSFPARNCTQEYYNVGTGAHYLSVPFSIAQEFDTGGKSETITGSRGPRDQVNEVQHDVVDVKINPCELSSFLHGYGTTRIDISGGNMLMWDRIEKSPPKLSAANLSVTYPKTTEQLLEEARQAFFQVNETDNLLNMIEAHQTISSIGTLGAMLSSLKNNTARVYDLWKPSGPNRHRFSKSDISNLYLAWSFGFAPLIADAKKIARDLPRLRRNLAALARNAAKPHAVTRRSQGTLSLSIDGSVGYKPVGTPRDYFHCWHTEINNLYAPLRTAGVFGQRHVVYQSDEFQTLDYLMARYIATGPISLAWEKVKYSFAVDWFVNLTGLIDRMDNALTGNAKQIKRAWSSEKFEVLLPIIYDGWDETTFQYDGQQVALYDIKSYHRVPQTLDYSVKWSGRFGKNQGYLTAALLHQYVANLKR